MEYGQIVIDQSVFVTVLITALGSLLVFTAVLLTIFGKYLISSLDKKLDVLTGLTKDNKKHIVKVDDKINSHVDKHHT